MNENKAPTTVSPGIPRGAIGFAVGLLVLVAALWVFPEYWYTRSGSAVEGVWLQETNSIPGWSFREVPVAEAAERLLSADRLVSGEFKRGSDRDTARDAVRVFAAKRYTERPNDIGLFVHTPDRCWTEAGWRLEPVMPDLVEIDVHGVRMQFERRVFSHGTQRELVYFGGMVGGRPLPYRLDHNMSVGMRFAMKEAADKTGTTLRAADTRFWKRVWESFVHRRPLLGPKQFVRVSTAVSGSDVKESDDRLRGLLEQWLIPVEYQAELRAWEARPKEAEAEKPAAPKNGHG
ncbi:MAG TPA: exosortase-associated EpsI family protein [Verrucomicrobiota bacterium]|nr:exosortase-associated EpsI family protein [Verrucomicrobiota bacterium]